MIEGTILKNGKIRLVITGSDDIDKALLKQLNGAKCTIITDNFRLGDRSITDGLMIEAEVEKKQQEPE